MLFAVGAVLGTLLLAGAALWLTSRKYRRFPGLGIPLVGNLYNAIRNIPTGYESAVRLLHAAHERDGDTLASFCGPFVFISTKDPMLLEELAFDPSMNTKEPALYTTLHGIIEGPFSNLYADAKWKREKKYMTRSMNKDNLMAYTSIFDRRSRELLEVLAKKSGEFDLLPWVFLMMLDIVVETHTGVRYHKLSEGHIELVQEIVEILCVVLNTSFSLGLLKVDHAYLKKFKNAYEFNRKGAADLIELLNNSKPTLDYDPVCYKFLQDWDSNSCTIEGVMKFVCEFILEGQYTVGTCLCGALLHLAVNPEFQDKVWEEQRDIFGDSLESPTYEHLKHMNYLERVVKESFRITSAPLTIRRSSSEIKTGDKIIPKNATVVFFWDGLRKDTRYWEHGGKFYPDHFLPEEVAKRPKCANFSFSAGPRACPGGQYATNCCKIVISNVIRHFKLSSPLKPQDLTYHAGLFSHLDVPHTVSLEPRL